MKPSDSRSQIAVGLFFVLGTVLLAASILAFGGGVSLFRAKYELQVLFPQAQGLARGAEVSLAGLTIGHVSNIDLHESGKKIHVFLSIEKRYFSRLTDSASASIRTQGALGDKFVYINPGEQAGTPLKNKDFIARDPQPDFFEFITETASDLSNTGDLLGEMTNFFKSLNHENRSALLMEKLIQASHNIQSTAGDPELKASMKSLNSILNKVDSGQGTLGLLINDRELYDRLNLLFGESPRNQYLRPLLRESLRKADHQN